MLLLGGWVFTDETVVGAIKAIHSRIAFDLINFILVYYDNLAFQLEWSRVQLLNCGTLLMQYNLEVKWFS
ncbi:MAG: hypothetical protein CMK72_04700 [Pseudomonadaceae bacterium]|nr:hypothetical protein [Pseudomonadaceae bacterium]HCP57432.1 hypothetical protein [Pseudomonas sp.]